MVYNCNHIISRANRSASPMIPFAIVLQYNLIQAEFCPPSHFSIILWAESFMGEGGNARASCLAV